MKRRDKKMGSMSPLRRTELRVDTLLFSKKHTSYREKKVEEEIQVKLDVKEQISEKIDKFRFENWAKK